MVTGKSIVLALDPSINETGWATNAKGGASGVIKTVGKTAAERLFSLFEQLRGIFDSYPPHIVVVEVPASFAYTRSQNKWTGKGVNTESLLLLSRAVGVCLAVGQMCAKKKVIEVKGNEWKGRANKDIARMVTGKKNHNEADAVMLLNWASAREGLALSRINSGRFSGNGW